MATDVPMPKLGLTMEEATIIEWLVADGVTVDTDQPILRIETDKTETEVGSPGAGRLHIIGKPGDVFACGVRIGVLLGEGEAAPAAATPAAPAASAAKVGWPIWSSTNRRVGCSPASRRMVFTMLLPCTPHNHDVRTTEARAPSTSASRSPMSFDHPYTLRGAGSSCSWYGRSRVPSNT